MANEIGAAALSAGTGLVGSIVNSISSNILAEKQFEYSKQLAEQQNQFNIDMWRMQNEYNTPQAQMQRLQAAGLNPNLMYGQGTTGNASHAPQAVVASPPDYTGVMHSISKLTEAINVAKAIQEYRSLKLQNNRLELSNEFARESMWNRLFNEQGKAYYNDYRASMLQSMLRGQWLYGGSPDSLVDGASKYYADKYRFENTYKDWQNKLQRANLNLVNLQVPYLRMRNVWQPWQYGVDMAGDVAGSLLGFKNLFKSSKNVVKDFNYYHNARY